MDLLFGILIILKSIILIKMKKQKRKGIPKINVDDKKAVELLLNKRAKNACSLTRLGKADRKYLGGMFEVLRNTVEPTIVEGPAKAKTKPYKYTPREMWNNIAKYFEVSIEYGQPLTITGMGVFNGINRKDLFDIIHSKTLAREFYFLKECASFVEMYNEYAVHKKQNPAGPIFVLKNFGWKDKFEIEASANDGSLSEEERAAAQKRISKFTE